MTTQMFTKGPWRWAIKEWDSERDAYYWRDVDVATFKSTGYCSNPQLVGVDAAFDEYGECAGIVVSAGDGEYTPFKGDTDDERRANAYLLAAAPQLYAAAVRALQLLYSLNGGLPANTPTGDDLRAALTAARGEKS